MVRKTALIKISGDLCHRDDVLKWIKKIVKNYFTVICVGGGTQINKVFTEQGLNVKKHGPLGRETRNFKERQLARDILEKNQSSLQDSLALKNITASVVIPVLDIGTVLCHVNGDIFILTAYNGYDKVYVVTTNSRVKKKKEDFSQYPKIEVIGFPSKLKS